jgi:hypothetical protein
MTTAAPTVTAASLSHAAPVAGRAAGAVASAARVPALPRARAAGTTVTAAARAAARLGIQVIVARLRVAVTV